jgi:5'-nucleotidase (lipoprotein e(P4) family)
MRFPLSCAVLAMLALGACQPTRPQAPPAPVAVAADDNLNAVLWVQRSQEYRASAAQTYRAAIAQLDRALAEDWDALAPLERPTGVAAGRRPAVVLDIDETVLDNSPYQARLVRDGGEFNDPDWDAWVEERKAQPVPGVVEFARAANDRGITLVYISNRTEQMKQATLDNLRAVGLPVADDSVYMGMGMDVPGCDSRGSEKLCRRQLAARRYRVLMQFGDQLGDFLRVADNSAGARQALLDQHGNWFGQRWWMLPNPTYGGWEAAAFDNNRTLPRHARRAAKRAALETAP